MKVETFLTKTGPKNKSQILANEANSMSIGDLEAEIKEMEDDMTFFRRLIVNHTGFLTPKKLAIYQKVYQSKLQSSQERYHPLRTDYC
jgi:hypothetical protein